MTADPSEANRSLDIAIIGAGIYGIQAACTYLELHPNDSLAIVDVGKTIGGVWSKDRVYDAFWTQTPLGILEFSDLPLDDVPESERYHDFFPAKYVAHYLESYVNLKSYAGRSLADRVILQANVTTLEKNQAGWCLHIEHRGGTPSVRQYTMTASKVIDATGLTSKPNVPHFAGRDTFAKLMIHSKDFASHQQQLLLSDKYHNVVVIGGAKSAADVAYACAKAGRQVSWIIRRSGSGPATFVSAKGSWPYRNSNESFYTRFTSHFLASYFFNESSTWLGRFLYRTRLGRRLIQRVWKSINAKAWKSANYDRADVNNNGFSNLKPDTEIFWQNDSTGICQRPDFFDTILENVRVHREDISCLHQDGVELSDGSMLSADAIIFATGWQMSHPEIRDSGGAKESDLRLSLGLPLRCDQQDQLSKERWSELESSAIGDMLTRFPFLADAPKQTSHTPTNTPLRLYKGMLPINDRTIAFVGQMLLGNNFRAAEVQALYAVAALDGTLQLPAQEDMETTIARTIAWNRLRYLAKGQLGNWLYWDLVPYTDELLRELGLSSHRHKYRWKDLFIPCFAHDLRGILDEYRGKHLAVSPRKEIQTSAK